MRMPVPLLRLRRYAARNGCCHIARNRIPADEDLHIHRHDFPELFWVEHGGGRHRIGGSDHPLSAGDLWFIRPEDEHGLAGGAGGLTIVNLAVAPPVAGELARRYPGDGDLWTGGPAGRRRRLDPAALRRLGAAVEPLARAWGGPRERLALDRLMLELLDVLAAPAAAMPGPEWLRRAIATVAADPRLTAAGAPALRALAGRSREHLARSVRAHLGVTVRDLLRDLRLEQAARALRLGDGGIAGIALDAGFANLSGFYRRFRARFGCTPLAYRRRHAEPLRAPATPAG